MKRAILEITDQLLLDLLKGFNFNDERLRFFNVIGNPLPDDTKPVRCQIMDNGNLGILVESESFENIRGNTVYPTLDKPVLRTEFVDRKDITYETV